MWTDLLVLEICRCTLNELHVRRIGCFRSRITRHVQGHMECDYHTQIASEVPGAIWQSVSVNTVTALTARLLLILLLKLMNNFWWIPRCRIDHFEDLVIRLMSCACNDALSMAASKMLATVYQTGGPYLLSSLKPGCMHSSFLLIFINNVFPSSSPRFVRIKRSGYPLSRNVGLICFHSWCNISWEQIFLTRVVDDRTRFWLFFDTT